CAHTDLHSFRTRRSSDLTTFVSTAQLTASIAAGDLLDGGTVTVTVLNSAPGGGTSAGQAFTINNPVPSLGALLPNLVQVGSAGRSEEHTSELQSRFDLVC